MSTDSQPSTVLSLARLATLTAHLLPSGNQQPSDHLLPHPLLAQSPVANLNGTLTIVDERTGKKYQVQISPDATVKATDLKKVSFGYVSSWIMIIDQSFIYWMNLCFFFVLLNCLEFYSFLLLNVLHFMHYGSFSL